MMTLQDPPAAQPGVGAFSALVLNYAPPRRFARLRRWLRPGSPVFVLLVLALAIVGALGVWKWRLKADERAFKECASFGAGDFLILKPGAGWITFSKPPNAASLRHLNRLSGAWELYFNWPGPEDPAAPLALRGSRCNGVTVLWLGKGVDADVWLKELTRPDSGLPALATLGFGLSKVTDAGMKELARPESGLLALTTLDLTGTSVTDAGLKELARPDSGLKVLTTLYLRGTPVTDAGLMELARPDSGLKALATLDLAFTRVTEAGPQVTDAGLKELARQDSGLNALTTLCLDGTGVTDAGVAELEKARPGLTIYQQSGFPSGFVPYPELQRKVKNQE